MKKIILCLMATLMSLAMLPFQTNAAVPAEPSTETTAPKPESAEVKSLELRLYAIKELDKSKLKSSEKKQLRKEVKAIKHRLNDLSNGFYVSAGVLLVIALLLILLLL